MLFNSVEFLLFFPLVIFGYFALPQRFRRYFLLAASLYFYMSFIPKYILILLFTTCVDFFGALGVEKARTAARKRLSKAVFLLAVCANVGLLVYFKYLGLLEDTINFFGHMLDMRTVVLPDVVLPIGISFHTFQSMGYLIDVYTGREKAEHSFIDFSLFLMYFPQLVAGPIERSRNLFDQLKAHHVLQYENLSVGGRWMLWGMFKKVVVADNLTMFADAVFGDVHAYSGFGLIAGILCFTVQIYCDFSGYSDIAIGAARVMDIRLMQNFDTPYFSRSIPEFWRRWHISLSTWFRDYVYIPLGGNRVSKPRWCFNQLVTFAISGIWHGASFTFVVWGLLNGVYIVLSRFTRGIREKIKHLLRLDRIAWISAGVSIAITFVLTALSWVFFRANTFSDAFYVLSHLTAKTVYDFPHIAAFRGYIACAAPLLLFGVEIFTKIPGIPAWFTANTKKRCALRLVSYGILVAIIVIFGAYDNKSFIYFQF